VEHNYGVIMYCKWSKHGQADLWWETTKWNGTNTLQYEVGKVGQNNDKFGVTLYNENTRWVGFVMWVVQTWSRGLVMACGWWYSGMYVMNTLHYQMGKTSYNDDKFKVIQERVPIMRFSSKISCSIWPTISPYPTSPPSPQSNFPWILLNKSLEPLHQIWHCVFHLAFKALQKPWRTVYLNVSKELFSSIKNFNSMTCLYVFGLDACLLTKAKPR